MWDKTITNFKKIKDAYKLCSTNKARFFPRLKIDI